MSLQERQRNFTVIKGSDETRYLLLQKPLEALDVNESTTVEKSLVKSFGEDFQLGTGFRHQDGSGFLYEIC